MIRAQSTHLISITKHINFWFKLKNQIFSVLVSLNHIGFEDVKNNGLKSDGFNKINKLRLQPIIQIFLGIQKLCWRKICTVHI
jgi:hypothetical protein